MLREAYRRQPDSPSLRVRFATALLVQDAFDDVIALFDKPDTPAQPDTSEGAILIQAHLARETPEDNRRVVAIVDRLLPLLVDDVTRAQFLADQAKAHRRLGDPDVARSMLDHALELDPANKDACKRLAAVDLHDDKIGDTIAVLDRIAAKGVSHARLHAARALVHARAGQIETARDVIGFDDFHHAGLLDTPPGMASMAAFNTALAAELLDHPDLRYERYGTASEQSWRIDAPLLGPAPMVRLLLDQVARTAERHVATIAGSDHPWAQHRPDRGLLHCWCVMTDGTGYETWHVHQFGWLSGVYYVQIPPSIGAAATADAKGKDSGESGDTAGNGANDGAAGCIAFGLPEDLVGDAAAAGHGSRIVRPEEGMLMLFPSHSYHRTYPHGAAERRICVAFDIWPA